MSLFGGKRVVWIEPATKDIEEGVVALLEGAGHRKPGGGDRRRAAQDSALLKLAEASPLALAFASYAPEGQDAERMVIDLGRRFGLKIAPPVAARLADAARQRPGDRRAGAAEARALHRRVAAMRPRSSITTRSTRSAPTMPKAISCGSPISR